MEQAVISEEYCSDTERELTVRKTSLFAQGDGFAVYDHCTGELAFRVDMYPSVSGELVLMDPGGAPVLTVRKKRPSLHNRWEGFAGERVDGQNQKPLFTVRRSSIFGGNRAGMVVEVHGGVGPTEAETEYRIEGSFSQRCCKVLFEGTVPKGEAASLVAAIKRKVDPDAHVVMGKDVFSLFLAPHVDAAFIMGLVLVLDQVCSDEPGIAEVEIDLSSVSLAGDHHVIVNGGTLLEEHPAEVVM
ncbi:protein LURP-one-related 5-like protein [Carex littledalei]|uniref:Protein LURP-one-related 5-like protein n=1 Tax=Carex littledalei TaxID=544730 RepID=A0A833QX43_9POAL|nr:protein LURP-one-related 5-like protein [Carex littledalei]